jgi:tRNA (cmo5U34)-methyltransferase
MAIDKAFNESVDYYDSWVQKALPSYQEIFSVAVESIPFSTEQNLKILDLGAGTGLFSYHVFQQYQRADYTLIDVAEQMLELSKKRFASAEERFSFITGDYRTALPGSLFDLVISSLSIHHLDDEDKQKLFRNIYEHLTPGGAFINVDQIKASHDYFQKLYWTTWLKKVRHAGATEEQVQKSISRRTKFDQDSTMHDQLRWLQESGFEIVDCLYHYYFVGVFYARK